ncbi:MAG: LytR/AlgR family response regulator transcription factor [Salibacteraceae bacterium]
MKTINVAIIDDEIAAAENIQILLDSYCKWVNIVGMAHSIPSGFQLISKSKPDLVFLDISMPPEGTGFDLLDMFPNRDFHVIFVTAHEQYGLKAIKKRAFDYILKPIDYKELIQSMSQFSDAFIPKKSKHQILTNQIITLPTEDGTHIIKQKDLIFCKASGSYTEFHIINRNPIVISKPLKFAESILEMNTFKRVHRSFIINPNFITKINKEDGGSVFLNCHQIPVSKKYCEDILKLVK